MATFIRPFGFTLLAAAAFGLATAPAHAQQLPNSQSFINPAYRVGPNMTPINQAAYNVRTMGNAYQHVPPWTAGYNPYHPTINVAAPDYGGGYYGPTGYGAWGNSANGYLTGAASVINAQGQFAIENQQSNVIREQYHQAKLDTRRKTWEQWQWEQDHAPKLEDIRERDRQTALGRARNDPNTIDIWSGWAMNQILSNLERSQARVGAGPNVPFDPDLLKQLNFTAGTAPGSTAMVKSAGKLDWPFALQAPEFDAGRKQLQELADKAVQQLNEKGQPDYATIKGMNTGIREMQADLKSRIRDMSPDEYVQSKTFLNDLTKTVKGLQDPTQRKVALGQLRPQGSSVGELVASMTKQGLKFAPATPGNEAAYNAMYQALRSYDMSMAYLQSTGAPPRQ